MIFSTIQCDMCNETLSYRHLPKWLIIFHARKNGWSVGKTIKCENCKKIKKAK